MKNEKIKKLIHWKGTEEKEKNIDGIITSVIVGIGEVSIPVPKFR